MPETWAYDGTPFTGVFDGNGHVISHLTITGKRYLGLLGLVGSEAVVGNLGVAAVDITGLEDIDAIAGGNGDLRKRHIQPGTLSGWDFVGETANGTEDTWWIDEGKDYPRLWWEAAGN